MWKGLGKGTSGIEGRGWEGWDDSVWKWVWKGSCISICSGIKTDKKGNISSPAPSL